MRELFWPLEFRIYIFCPMRTMPFCPGNIKGRTNHSCPLFAFSLASSRTDLANMREHIRSLLTSISNRTDQPFPLSPQSSPQSIMRRAHPIYGPLVSGKSFIIHSKPTDPRRNKLDIFKSCFDFRILIPVLMTASQLLLWLQRL